MIIPILNHLNAKNILMVSTSPRRRALLKQLGLTINAVPSTFAEDLDMAKFPTPADYVKETAREKASSYLKQENLQPPKPLDLVIAADTIVVLDSEIIGKPSDLTEAKITLEKLNGRTHKVITGVALVAYERNQGEEIKIHERIFHEETAVTFARLTPEIIQSYVNTEEPLDKAGAYAIQGIGGSLIEKIDGDYCNVVGFPIHKFCRELMKLHDDKLL